MSAAVRIRAIAAGGDGVGELPDGRTLFVPRAAPGDLIEVRELTLAKRFARGRVARVLEPAPDRVAAPCPHYDGDDCGGCQLQHLSVGAQRAARARLVADALRRIGRLEIPEPSLEPSDVEWGYRAKVSLAVKGRRIGFHRVGRPNEVFDLDRCLVARPELSTLWTALRACRSLLPRNATQIVLRVDRESGRHVIVRSSTTEVWTRARDLGNALVREGVPAILWWEPAGGAPRAVFGSRQPYPAMVFEQVHSVMGDRIRAHAVAAMGSVSGLHCWDLYAGIGETTRALAERGATVESVEIDRRAVAVADARGPAAGVTRRVARVEDTIGQLTPADAVIVNPPRTGLDKAVTCFLAAQPPGRLVYVSCDPATLARDLARLNPKLQVGEVQAFDLFPQTAHVETVVRLERR